MIASTRHTGCVSDDTVLATTQIDKVTGQHMGISMFGTVNPNDQNGFPVLISDQGAAFPSLEATIGAGLNLNAAAGDTDLADSVLFIARFDCP